LLFIYKYKNGHLFGVRDVINCNFYDLASIKEFEKEDKWERFVVVKEGAFMWDVNKQSYIKL